MNPAPHIYVLDIDGTLMRTHEIDNECYWRAVEEVFALDGQSRALIEYRHVSDTGILEQWCREVLGRAPRPQETRALKQRFLHMLESIAVEQPELFEPRPGLEDWLTAMSGSPGIQLAIATGGWRDTASFKLARAGLTRFKLALATSDDAISRTDIMRAALQRLGRGSELPPSHITYVGDGPWDVHAAREIGWNFIGIAEGDRARALRDLGADPVHADFRPLVGTVT